MPQALAAENRWGVKACRLMTCHGELASCSPFLQHKRRADKFDGSQHNDGRNSGHLEWKNVCESVWPH